MKQWYEVVLRGYVEATCPGEAALKFCEQMWERVREGHVSVSVRTTRDDSSVSLVVSDLQSSRFSE